MIHRLPELPYPLNGLAPRISAETLEYHWVLAAVRKCGILTGVSMWVG
jgi:hypothetical protein